MRRRSLPPVRVFLSVCSVMAAGCYPEVPFEGGEAKEGLVGDDGDDGSTDTPGGSDGDDGGSGDGGDGSDGSDGGDGGVELCEGYVDGDGDGVGGGELVEYECGTAGYVELAGDCDDGNAEIFPDAPERCNEVDDDCDGEIDNDILGIWYVDGDGDGFGDAEQAVETCDPGEGLVADNTDCDDAVATTYPGADEVCNFIDDDCDVDIDEDAVDATAWYDDTDGDGYGDPLTELVQCEAPSDVSVAVAGDCDDTVTAVSPDATEVCDSIDNDCDGDIDDADASLDASTGLTSWADIDGDGFGDLAAPIQTCIVPSGYVEDFDDCNDADSAINPDATEVCDSIDNDCDGDIDDDDASVDPSVGGSTYYADSDGDGYGDLETPADACLAPSGFVVDDTDCDDSTAAVRPGANEVCNGIDDDCDALTDDDDPSLDTSTWLTWYADSDGDGLGDATVSAQACDAPSGYVSDDTDCDDASTSDIDGDGTQDCADDDIDGDGLRNGWDVDPEDDTIVRGPTGGLGTDGVATVTGSEVWGSYTLLASSASSGATTLSVSDASAFASGDELLILDQQGTDSGQYEFVFVDSISSTTITIEPPLSLDWDASDVVLVQEVPHYTTVTISGDVSADDWEGSGGGVVAFRATGAVTIGGSIDVGGLGYRGGDGVAGNSNDAFQGESYLDEGSRGVRSANEGGGGSRGEFDDSSVGGGGGAHASNGSDGGDMWCCSYAYGSYGGNSYGSSTMASLFFGSGGGAGTPESKNDGNDSRNVTGDGGDGGGILAIFSATSITTSGSIEAAGRDGGDASWSGMSSGGEIGGGGGGAGGSIWLSAPSVTMSGTVDVDGGDGGLGLEDYPFYGSYQTTPYGGDGSEGRVYVQYSTGYSNSSGTAATTGAYTD